MNLNTKQEITHKTIFIFMLLVATMLIFVNSSLSGPIRIVVLPGYAEDGTNITEKPVVANHYRRVMRFINNQLVRHGFEVINPTALELTNKTTKDQDRHIAFLATCMLLNQKYGTDAAYIIWLTVNAKRSHNGFCVVTANLEGEGYDSSGRDLGAGLSKQFKTIRKSCDEAVNLAEKEIGDLVGRVLTAHQTK